ncbi:L-lactate permease [Leuconostoc falkenbergense]|uniref:L-lactate permease n=1 Tax=Leuconostoc falkenbergense TaxID=2766470 RepID=UPI0024AE1F5A|nr:L-lactate permease [Leuconostoc falkenbergense]MDI6667299.1 L-lactate permease [Leuconostoc falkenbergense]
MILVSLLAVILPLVFLVVMNLPAITGMTLSALIVAVSTFVFWKMPIQVLSASILQAVHKTIPILWILFGALMMLAVLQLTGAIVRINEGFTVVTSDMRILTIFIAFLFGGLIEGVSGFGTPAMVTAPLLMALGFRPIAAVTLALVGDSTAASFGAVGTPLTVGLSNVAQNKEAIQTIGETVTQVDLTSGIVVPTLMIMLLVFFFGNESKQKKIKSFLEIVPWALMVGFCYVIVAMAVVNLIGYEFSSVITPLIVLLLAIVTVKFKIFLPKSVFQQPWHAAQDPNRKDVTSRKSPMSLGLAWLPYLLVVVLLLLSRTVPMLKQSMTQVLDLSWRHILGFQTISSDWQFLYSPGTILVIAALIGLYCQSKTIRPFVTESKKIIRDMLPTAITLAVTLIMVQIFSNSGLNQANLASMPTYIAKTIATVAAPFWVVIAPFIGELGAFITGSATVSTLTFAPIQYDVANQAQLSTPVILAMQVIGAAAGNMICVHNIVAAGAVVGLGGNEGIILRKTALPALIYGFLLGLTGLLLLNYLK